jgi:hypothetical protein
MAPWKMMRMNWFAFATLATGTMHSAGRAQWDAATAAPTKAVRWWSDSLS